ncbi:hypothetical protein OFS07_00525 [Brachyspira hyodysenteriae]|nr:hypothetical protein [Brachyspira hyodysenteriae]MDA0064773.1 hypothetical protein [Brachyspira hyodysenteriae]MDA0072721.1 hypothetical protein [Brachyspira hyodysenteriae]
MTLQEKKQYDFNIIKEWKKITNEEESIIMRNKILINLKLLVYKVVNSLYYIKSFEKEELINIGFMGLIKRFELYKT